MRLTLTQFMTLDGVTQGPGGREEDPSGGFDLGGWSMPFVDEDFGRWINGWFRQADAFLLGRRTYDIFAGHWPRVTDPADPIASRLNGLPKYVVSRTLHHPEWGGTSVLNEDVLGQIAELKRQEGRELQVHGSTALARFLLAHGVVDELRLFVHPVVLGGGRRFFAEGEAPAALRLRESGTTHSGVAVLVYEPAGEPLYGEAPPPGE
ncbi:dihydrofolate reductase family protein [Streptomyces sp. RFCAC02]|uniref:dihydrofolate reductase family protein n=1 Tax=Streptomyces sp. RFCAC02 TaxID=2499143 RepID=UPI00101F3221|nr:dihydrofolate reductase family protein [Streptomyces sp. RFCAC02]